LTSLQTGGAVLNPAHFHLSFLPKKTIGTICFLEWCNKDDSDSGRKSLGRYWQRRPYATLLAQERFFLTPFLKICQAAVLHTENRFLEHVFQELTSDVAYREPISYNTFF
jgi:hypothetical protein